MWYSLLLVIGSLVCQNNWIDGSGVLGPVADWGTHYWAGDSINWTTQEQLSLAVTKLDCLGWVKHTIESSGGIKSHAQGLTPADIDGDGIPDIVAHTDDSVVWYKHNGAYGFEKYPIGLADDGGVSTPCVYPCDLDKDWDIDVVVGTQSSGIGWFENDSLEWVWHQIHTTHCHRISVADLNNDGWLDIIAVDNSSNEMCGDIGIFLNDGSQNFYLYDVIDLPAYEGWRVGAADFNKDGFPDIYSIYYSNYVYLNDSTAHFYLAWYDSSQWFDGAYAEDINMDGNLDIVCGNRFRFPFIFYGLLNDSTGSGWTFQLLQNVQGDIFGSGLIAKDIDLDGYPDIAGSYTRVGWFRHNSESLLTFTLNDIGELNKDSHWLSAGSLCRTCIPKIDLLVTEKGVHSVYKNNMFTFANNGYIESSILEISSTGLCSLNYFRYKACVPNDSAICFYIRVGVDSADIVNEEWGAPFYATAGMNVIDSFAIGLDSVRMVQYRVEFTGVDDSPILSEVCLDYTPLGVEEPVGSIHRLPLLRTTIDGKVILSLSHPINDVRLAIYDVAGRSVQELVNGRLLQGTYEWTLEVNPGIYFATLYSGELKVDAKSSRYKYLTKKLIKLK